MIRIRISTMDCKYNVVCYGQICMWFCFDMFIRASSIEYALFELKVLLPLGTISIFELKVLLPLRTISISYVFCSIIF